MMTMSINLSIFTFELPLALAILFISSTKGFPSGAPLSACRNLMPIHEDAIAEESAAPYIILMSETNYTSGEPIQGK